MHGISYSTYVFGAFTTMYMILEMTDYFDGKYDPLGPYPRNPKRQQIGDDVKKIIEGDKYDNIRRPMFVPIIDHRNPLAAPDRVHK